MQNKSCYIVEDNKSDLAILESFLKKVPGIKVTGTGSSYSEAMQFLLTNKVEILFLDVELSGNDGSNGYDILKVLPLQSSVIVTTNHQKYAVESYDIGKAKDFLLKPYSYERFQLALNRALSKPMLSSKNEEKKVYLKAGRKFEKVVVSELDYIEAYGIYVKIYLEGSRKPIVINESLGTILQILDSDFFLRVHKSYAVNMNKVDSYDSNSLFVNSRPIPVGRSHKKDLDNYLKLFSSLD